MLIRDFCTPTFWAKHPVESKNKHWIKKAQKQSAVVLEDENYIFVVLLDQNQKLIKQI